MLKMMSLVGARPQFIKEACLSEAVLRTKAWEHVLVHSGQHYDDNMSQVFFDKLEIAPPRHCLRVGSGSHAVMTASILTKIEHILQEERPDGLIVYGDTDTTLAGALAAAKLGIPIVHVEAGIRMLPRSMPEEINRVLTDRVSSVLCCCSNIGVENLRQEGIRDGVAMTGDIMLDVFRRLEKSFNAKHCETWGLRRDEFILTTLHRNYNVDNPEILHAIMQALEQGAKACGLPVLFPLHPRTRQRLEALGMLDPSQSPIRFIPPQGYQELMSLVAGAAFVVTDSGGLQKEAAYAGKRAVVVMPDTGWRELVDCGWNIQCDATTMAHAMASILEPHAPLRMPYGDGHAADAVIKAVQHGLAGKGI